MFTILGLLLQNIFFLPAYFILCESSNGQVLPKNIYEYEKDLL